MNKRTIGIQGGSQVRTLPALERKRLRLIIHKIWKRASHNKWGKQSIKRARLSLLKTRSLAPASQGLLDSLASEK